MKKEKRWIRWNKEVIVIFGLTLFLLVVSIAYAGVLNYYGKIVGTANVQGPIFYADISTRSLLLNQKPTTDNETNFTDGSNVVFCSDDLGGVDFNYIPKCEFYVKACSNVSSQIIVACYYNNMTNMTNKICEEKVNTATNCQVLHTYCNGTSTLSGVSHIIYEIKGADSTVAYYIQTNSNGDTRLQINKVGE